MIGLGKSAQNSHNGEHYLPKNEPIDATHTRCNVLGQTNFIVVFAD